MKSSKEKEIQEPLTEEEIEDLINTKYSTKDNYTKEFTRKGIRRFGNIFDYSKTVRVDNNRTKVIITCPTHGDFEIDPQYFVKSKYCKGCPMCNPGRTTKLTLEQFMSEVTKKYPHYTSTENTRYIDNRTKLELRCTIHDVIFQITPANLLYNNRVGCPGCGKRPRDVDTEAKRIISLQKYKEKKLISRINSRFPEYDTSKIHYVDNFTEITLICKIDNVEFCLSPDQIKRILKNNKLNILCPKCKKKLEDIQKKEIFLEKCIQRYGVDQFDFSNMTYISSDCPVTGVICKKCGKELKTNTANSFLNRDAEYYCECEENERGSLGEIRVRHWLEENKFDFTEQYRVLDENLFGRRGPGSKVVIDFRIVLENNSEVWIEFNGAQHYKFNDRFFHNTVDDFICQVMRDYNVRKYCSLNNIKLVEIPYTYSSLDSIHYILYEVLIKNRSYEDIIKIPEIDPKYIQYLQTKEEEQKNEEQ